MYSMVISWHRFHIILKQFFYYNFTMAYGLQGIYHATLSFIITLWMPISDYFSVHTWYCLWSFVSSFSASILSSSSFSSAFASTKSPFISPSSSVKYCLKMEHFISVSPPLCMNSNNASWIKIYWSWKWWKTKCSLLHILDTANCYTNGCTVKCSWPLTSTRKMNHFFSFFL